MTLSSLVCLEFLEMRQAVGRFNRGRPTLQGGSPFLAWLGWRWVLIQQVAAYLRDRHQTGEMHHFLSDLLSHCTY